MPRRGCRDPEFLAPLGAIRSSRARTRCNDRYRGRNSPMIEVRDNPDQVRYDIFVDGKLAGFARYVRKGKRIVFVHTEIDDAHEGQGLGSKLAQGALDDARTRGLAVVPLCPFIER